MAPDSDRTIITTRTRDERTRRLSKSPEAVHHVSLTYGMDRAPVQPTPCRRTPSASGMAEAAECCSCCFLCCACFAVCGRACLWLPLPGSRKRAKEMEADELYAQQVAEEEILRQGRDRPSPYSADYRPTAPMTANRAWTPPQHGDPRIDAHPRPPYGEQYSTHPYPPGQPTRDAHQYLQDPQQHASHQRGMSIMSGSTLQGTEDVPRMPGEQQYVQPQRQPGFPVPNHRPSHSDGRELDQLRRSQGTNENRGPYVHPPQPENRPQS